MTVHVGEIAWSSGEALLRRYSTVAHSIPVSKHSVGWLRARKASSLTQHGVVQRRTAQHKYLQWYTALYRDLQYSSRFVVAVHNVVFSRPDFLRSLVNCHCHTVLQQGA